MGIRFGGSRIVAGIAMSAVAMLLAACGGGSSASDDVVDRVLGQTSVNGASSASEAAAPSPTRTVEVDVEKFATVSGYAFRYELDGGTGECSFSELGVGCMGTAADDIPDVVVPPFRQQRPSSVSITEHGTDYLIYEGGPPAPATLEAGETVTDGATTCTALDESTLTCEWGGDSFTLSGKDADITTSAEPRGMYFVDERSRSRSASRSAMAGPGESCGTARSTEFPGFDGRNVEVREGNVDCGKAMEVVTEYLATPTDADHGNANMRTFGDWNCAMPTWGSSQRSGFSLNCSGPDGESVGIRN